MDKIQEMTKRINDFAYRPNMQGMDIRTKEGKDWYRAEGKRLQEQFNIDALAALDLSGHPKGKRLMRIAWNHGHGGGYLEVFQLAEEMTDLLKD